MGSRRQAARTLLCIAGISLLLSGCSGQEGTSPENIEATDDESDAFGSSVEIGAVDNTFSPGSLAVTAGSEVAVEFTNNGSNPHTFTSDALGFDTGSVAPGDTATVTFEASAGTAEFFCSIHAGGGMTGTIVAE